MFERRRLPKTVVQKSLILVHSSDGDVGICLPEAATAGDPCEAGLIAPNADSHQDRVTKVMKRSCGAAGACETNRVGFPGGMCEASCASHAPGVICTGIPILVGFNGCLAKKIPFEQCIAENTTPGGVRACDAATPCRDDYVCARGATGGGRSRASPRTDVFANAAILGGATLLYEWLISRREARKP